MINEFLGNFSWLRKDGRFFFRHKPCMNYHLRKKTFRTSLLWLVKDPLKISHQNPFLLLTDDDFFLDPPSHAKLVFLVPEKVI